MMLLPICFLEAMMDTELEVKIQTEGQITVEDVNRVLEIGQLHYSGITPEEARSPHRAGLLPPASPGVNLLRASRRDINWKVVLA